MAAPAEGREVLGVPSFQNRLTLGLKGIQKSIEKQAATVVETFGEGDKLTGGVSNEGQKEVSKEGGQVNALFAWAEKAKKAVADKVVYDVVPQEVDENGDAPDVEKGEGLTATAKNKGMWAMAASAVKNQAALAAEEANKGLQKAKAVEWGEPASMVSKGMKSVAGTALDASASLQQQSKAASQKALAVKDKANEKLSEAKSNAGQAAAKAKDKASAAAGAAKNKLSEAGQTVGGAVGGVGALAMNPKKLATFVGIFFVGCLLITLSFSFLPVLVISPQKFALLFALGSLVIMGSLAFLKGPKALASQLMQREKLPFSSAYIVGLVGTLVSTIVLRSFILTAVFGIIQAVALLYFLASYVPGGKALLNFCGRCTSRLTQKLMCGSCSGSK